MNKVLLTLAFFLLVISHLLAQNPGDLDNSFNGSGKVYSDLGTDDNRARAIAIQPDGKILIGGYTDDVGITSDMVLVRYNANGDIDNTFGNNGKMVLDINGQSDRVDVIKVLSNGKILVGGKNSGVAPQYTLVQFNANGTLDNSFGTGGIAEYSSGAVYGMVIQNDGKIVATGYNSLISSHFSLFRCDANGNLDSSFGTSGVVVTDPDSSEALAYSIAMQSDGKVLIGGIKFGVSYNQFALNRYNTNGNLDNTFGGDGKTEVLIGEPYQAVTFGQAYEPTIFSLLVQDDGKIVAVGQTDVDSIEVFALCRFNADGSLDNSFGTGGMVTTDIGNGSDIAYEAFLQPDGKILVAGVSTDNSLEAFALARYNSDGSLDNSFGVNGITTIIFTGFGNTGGGAYAVTMQADNKIVAAGYTGLPTGNELAIAQYFSGLEVGIEENTGSFKDLNVYPNPIIDAFQVQYTLVEDEELKLTLTDSEGKLITTYLTNASRKAGIYNETFDIPKDLAAGVYFIQFNTSKGNDASVRVIKANSH